MFDLMGGKVARGEGSGTELAGEYTFFYGKGNENHELGAKFFVHKRIILAGKRVEFVSDRISHIILRGCWFHIIVLNVLPQQRMKLMMLRKSYMRTWSMCLINSLNTVCKCC
jgi:hypothetical protein